MHVCGGSHHSGFFRNFFCGQNSHYNRSRSILSYGRGADCEHFLLDRRYYRVTLQTHRGFVLLVAADINGGAGMSRNSESLGVFLPGFLSLWRRRSQMLSSRFFPEDTKGVARVNLVTLFLFSGDFEPKMLDFANIILWDSR